MKQIITQRELAILLRVPANSLCKYFSGGGMSHDNVSRVWRVTGISLEILYNGTRAEKISAIEEWCGKKINFGRGRTPGRSDIGRSY